MPADGLIYVVLPRATCGLIVTGGTVVDAPPYLRRVKGADARRVWRELARQAIRLQWIPNPCAKSVATDPPERLP